MALVGVEESPAVIVPHWRWRAYEKSGTTDFCISSLAFSSVWGRSVLAGGLSKKAYRVYVFFFFPQKTRISRVQRGAKHLFPFRGQEREFQRIYELGMTQGQKQTAGKNQ